MTSLAVTAVATGAADSSNLRVLDAAGNRVNSVGLAFYGEPEPDVFRTLRTALAQMKYRRLSDWRLTTDREYVADVERF